MEWPTQEGIAKALEEVRSKEDPQIDGATAETWGYRAIACYMEYERTRDPEWLLRAKGHSDEAIEHAGLVRDQGQTLRQIERGILAAERKAGARGGHRYGT